MAQVKVISEQTVLSNMKGREGKQDLWVLYQVSDGAGKFDPTRTFQVFVPYEEVYDPTTRQMRDAVLQQYIKEHEARRMPENPKIFTV